MVKTYPCPSSKYIETCCTAGITESGKPIRIYPVPFRQLLDDHRYKKWQWISAPVAQSNTDSRHESYKIQFTEIELLDKVDTSDLWSKRLPWICKFPRYYDIEELARDGKAGVCSLAYMKVDVLDKLEIKKAKREKFTKQQLEDLARSSRDLFSDQDLCEIENLLEKIPYDFYYHFTINNKAQKAKIIDWEICQLYRNCVKDYGENWAKKLEQKYYEQYKNFTLYLIMGNQARFRKQFMIISVCAVPKRKKAPSDDAQLLLL